MVSRTTDISKVAEGLSRNEVVAIPTETVYGLAANSFSPKAVEKIFNLKNRPLFNPLIVHLGSIDMLKNVAVDIPPIALKLAQAFWPGPLTMVLNKHPNIPEIVSAGLKTVAVRIPNHPLTLELLNSLDFPLAAPSANPFGSISPTKADHVEAYFEDSLQYILDGGTCSKGIESTIIGFENGQAIVFRLGSTPIEDIETVIGQVTLKTTENKTPVAPGMLDRHYAPATNMQLTTNSEQTVRSNSNKKLGLLVFKDKIEHPSVKHQEILSKEGNLEEAAHHLYAALHRLDALDLELIIAELVPDVGLGKTINDKLRRASVKT
jgi:L-threonylcarbamoyladenylate synthase